jgi:hypothetical protein
MPERAAEIDALVRQFHDDLDGSCLATFKQANEPVMAAAPKLTG